MTTTSHATGPVTVQGKETVSRNGLVHGLTGKKHILLPGESKEEFDARQQDLLTQWEPASMKEAEAVIRIAQAEWRLTRAQNLETQCFAEAMTAGNLSFAEAFDKVQDKLKLIMRYQGSISAEYNKAITLIQRLQAGRVRNENPENEANSPAEPPPPPETPPEPPETLETNPGPAKDRPAWLNKPPNGSSNLKNQKFGQPTQENCVHFAPFGPWRETIPFV